MERLIDENNPKHTAFYTRITATQIENLTSTSDSGHLENVIDAVRAKQTGPK